MKRAGTASTDDAAAVGYDVANIGAGSAGASLARRLSASASVLLIARKSQPEMRSTGRSAAMFIQTYGPLQVRGSSGWAPMPCWRGCQHCAAVECSARSPSPTRWTSM